MTGIETTFEGALWALLIGAVAVVAIVRLVQAALGATDHTDRRYDQ